jgi:hypothetical protein
MSDPGAGHIRQSSPKPGKMHEQTRRTGKYMDPGHVQTGARHVQQTSLEPGLGGQICLDFARKIG